VTETGPSAAVITSAGQASPPAATRAKREGSVSLSNRKPQERPRKSSASFAPASPAPPAKKATSEQRPPATEREIAARGAPARLDRCIGDPVCTGCERPLKERRRPRGEEEHQCTMCAAGTSPKELWHECLSCGHSLCGKCVQLVRSDTRFDAVDHVRCRKCKAVVRADRTVAHRKSCRYRLDSPQRVSGGAGASVAETAAAPSAVPSRAAPPIAAAPEDAATPVLSDEEETAAPAQAPVASQPLAAARPSARTAALPPHAADDEDDDDALPTTAPRFSGGWSASRRPAPTPIAAADEPVSTPPPTASVEELLLRSAQKAQQGKVKIGSTGGSRGGPRGESRHEALFREALQRGNIVELRNVPPTATAERLSQFLNAATAAHVALDLSTGAAWVAMPTRIMAHDAVATCSDLLFDDVQLQAQISTRAELPDLSSF